MSLQAIFDKEKTQSIKAVLPDELIVYKVVRFDLEKNPLLKTAIPRYVSPVCNFKYYAGEQSNFWDLNRFDVPLVDRPNEISSYYPGFHSFAQKTTAIKFLREHTLESLVLLTCGVLKDWIVAIGIEGERDMVIVSNRIIIPAYPHTDIRYDKNYEWFFEAQTKAKFADTHIKSEINRVEAKKVSVTYRQYKKCKYLRKDF